MKMSLGTLAMAGALALAILAAPTLASAADFFGMIHRRIGERYPAFLDWVNLNTAHVREVDY